MLSHSKNLFTCCLYMNKKRTTLPLEVNKFSEEGNLNWPNVSEEKQH